MGTANKTILNPTIERTLGAYMEVKFSIRRYNPESTNAVSHFQEYQLDMTNASTVLDGLIETLIEIIIQKNKLNLKNIGSFKIIEKKERIGRNPKTKEKKIISDREVVLFKPSKEFKEFINLKENE